MARSNSLLIGLLVLISFYLCFYSAVAEYSTCDFSDDLCDWTDSAGVNQSWVRTNSTTIDPGHDHTCSYTYEPLMFAENGPQPFEDGVGSILNPRNIKIPSIIKNTGLKSLEKKCYWLTTLPVAKFNNDQDFILISKKHSVMDRDGCFRFYYHFFGLSKASFYVQMNTKPSAFEATNLWAKFVPQGNRWANAQVVIPKQTTEFYIIFKAHLDSKYHDVVGIDDVSYSSYPCTPSGDTDFESGNNAWVLNGTNVTSADPIKDHTTNTVAGHYAISTKVQPSTLTAAITNLTRTFSSSEYSNCLKFYYRFIANKDDGDTTSYLDVNTTGSLYTDRRISVESIISDGLENTWQQMAVSIPSKKRALDKNYTVTISMNTQKTTRIAIDDIVVLDKICQPVGNCDFESDFCGFSQSEFADGLWIRSDGANSASFRKSPKTDATTHTEKGWFAMIPNELVTKGLRATLTSPPLGGSGATGSCFKFSYYAQTKADNESVLSVTMRDLTLYGKPIMPPVKVNGTTYGYWKSFSLPFPKKMPARYSIEISSVYSPANLLTDIAIDDLELAYSCSGRFDTTTPKPTIIPYNERKWDCDFQYTCSGWIISPDWIQASFAELGILQETANPPRVDHTQNKHTGRYLLYFPQKEEGGNATTQFVSFINSTNITGQPHCFSFYYFDASETLVQIDIMNHRRSYTYVEKSIRPNAASRTWQRVRVDFQYAYETFNISLVLHAARGANSSFALDDLKMVPGACQHMEDYLYTFDEPENMDINRIAPLKGGIGRLVSGRYVASQYPYAPRHDHTTGSGGYFLFMNAKGDYNTTYRTELVIDNLDKMDFGTAVKGRCVRFAYQISGVAKLRVYVDDVDSSYHSYAMFESAANHSNWLLAQTTYSAYYKHKITFLMEKTYGERSYIALDDVSFSNHCDRPIQCDFDDDVCSYNSDYNDNKYSADYEFARFVGPPITTQWPGPGYDHTKQGYGGGYLYLTGYPSKIDFKRTAMIQTPIMPMIYTPSSNSCISLFTVLTAADAELVVSIRFFALESGQTTTKVITLSGLSESKWTRHYADIDSKLFQNNAEFLIMIEGTTKKASTVIAIDDIDYSRSPCLYKHQFPCADKKKTINMDQVCNFKKDCDDGSDEAECGTCNFETDDCGWNNGTEYLSSKIGGIYVPTKAGSGPNVPDKDGSQKKDGHFLLVKKSPYSDKNYKFVSSAKLTRRYSNYQYQFKDAYFTCYMSFVSFLHSDFKNYSRANIEVWAGSDEDSAVLKLRVSARDGGDDWFLNAAYIGGFPHSFVVQFRASELSENETIALDNIEFNNCSFPDPVADESKCPDERAVMCNTTRICISPYDFCDFEDNCGDNWDESYALCSAFNTPDVPVKCAFEKSLDTCGISLDNVTAPNPNWKLARGYSYNYDSNHLPTADHTTKDKNGQFIELHANTKKGVGKEALLYTPMVTSGDDEPCVIRFFYYIDGDYNATTNNLLKVYAQYADGNLGESGILFKKQEYLRTWNKANAIIKSKKPFRFIFSGTINDYKGSISLDDISYTDTCYNSDAVYKPGKKGSSAFLIILLIVLALVVCGLAFFAFRKYQAGNLSFDSVQARIRSMMPGSGGPTAFDNPHFSK